MYLHQLRYNCYCAKVAAAVVVVVMVVVTGGGGAGGWLLPALNNSHGQVSAKLEKQMSIDKYLCPIMIVPKVSYMRMKYSVYHDLWIYLCNYLQNFFVI